jgi:hypothetical protein
MVHTPPGTSFLEHMNLSVMDRWTIFCEALGPNELDSTQPDGSIIPGTPGGGLDLGCGTGSGR